jgi:hypothetical protein
LRIGNIIEAERMYTSGWSWTYVGHETIYNVACGNEAYYRPIPLTEEWLLKFGFVAKSIDYNFTLGNIEIASAIRVLSTNERRNFYLDCEIPEWMKIKIEYVHQLQNLYFALTGEELQTKANPCKK